MEATLHLSEGFSIGISVDTQEVIVEIATEIIEADNTLDNAVSYPLEIDGEWYALSPGEVFSGSFIPGVSHPRDWYTSEKWDWVE